MHKIRPPGFGKRDTVGLQNQSGLTEPIAENGPRAIIVGAGPAGLTAALEFLEHTSVLPIVLEASQGLGGISKTVNYKGNRIDIGGHRFFSKSDRIMNWWAKILPIERTTEGASFTLRYQGSEKELRASRGVDATTTDQVMLVRSRRSRIFYLRRFFNYPIKLEWQTLKNLGPLRILRITLSYIKARILPRPENSLEDFFINRFGHELYQTFFRDYTEKVWGVPCSQIAPDWGAQRIKGLSVAKTLMHAATSLWSRPSQDLSQKYTETSLIEYFLYPKFGPGQMWETVARQVIERGGQVQTRRCVTRVHVEEHRVRAVTVRNLGTMKEERVEGEYFISTMPVDELIVALDGIEVPESVRRIARGLPFRAFITVGLLTRRLVVTEKQGPISDNWIYIQEPEVKVGRLQIFNNWSPYMVKDPDTVWMGLEYFVDEGDGLWNLSDSELVQLGIQELELIGLIRAEDVLDGTDLRVRKTYPAYFGTYHEFGTVRTFLDSIENLFLVGRNGMHRYNNQDHSMLTAMTAVENIRDGRTDKANIWDINLDQDYQEEK